jgi:hypothetical protein
MEVSELMEEDMEIGVGVKGDGSLAGSVLVATDTL